MFTSQQIWELSQVSEPPSHLPLIDEIIYLKHPEGNTNIEQEIAKVNQDGPRQLTVQKVDVDPGPMGCFMAHITALTQARTNGNLLVLEDSFKWDLPIPKICQVLKSVPQHFEDRWHVLVLSPTPLDDTTPVADTDLVLVQRHKVWPGYVVNANYIATLLHTWMELAFTSVDLCQTWKPADASDVWLGLNRNSVYSKTSISRQTVDKKSCLNPTASVWHVKTVNMQVQVPPQTKSTQIHSLLRELYLEAEPGHRLRIAVYGPNLTKKRHKRALSVNSFAGVKYFETESEATKWLGNDDIQTVTLNTNITDL